MKRFSLIGILIFVISGCEEENGCQKAPDISEVELNLKVTRLENSLFDLETKQEIADFLSRYRAFSDYFLGATQFPGDSMLIDNIYRLTKDPYIDTLRSEVTRIFGDFSDLEAQFETAFKYLKVYYPLARIPEIQTVITGFGQDLYISDSVIIVGLDYFLGKDGKYQPLDYPEYIRNRFQKDYIVPTCIQYLSNFYNRSNHQDKTMLADMIFYGKSYYFTRKMLPCSHDSLIIQYSGQQILDVQANQDIIWANFVENQFLFETGHFVKSKFMGERPYVAEIGKKCPGRIGAWLGWEIVNEYMDNHPKMSLPDLMDKKEAGKIFAESEYKPGG